VTPSGKGRSRSAAAGGYDLVFSRTAAAWSTADRKLLDTADGLGRHPATNLDIKRCHGNIITALGNAEHKLIGGRPERTSPHRITVSETNNMLERRANPAGRAASANVPRIRWAGFACRARYRADRNFMIEMVLPQRRLDLRCISPRPMRGAGPRCSTEPMTERCFAPPTCINADGQAAGHCCHRFKSSTPLPERVATTDLFHIVARKAAAAQLTFYMFGADEAENAAAVANVRKMYPGPADRRTFPRLPEKATRCGQGRRDKRAGRRIIVVRSAFPTSRLCR